jgi:hypothetical protein
LVVELQRAPEPGRELSRIDHAIVYILPGGRLKSKSKSELEKTKMAINS